MKAPWSCRAALIGPAQEVRLQPGWRFMGRRRATRGATGCGAPAGEAGADGPLTAPNCSYWTGSSLRLIEYYDGGCFSELGPAQFAMMQ